MEIRVEETLTGRELRDAILAKHGSRDAVEAAARRSGAFEAKDELQDLRLLAERPERLDDVYTVTTVARLRPQDLDRMTPARLRILDRVGRAKRPVHVTELARRLGRDKKNVSEDVRVLEAMGLLRTRREGRRKYVEVRGSEIRIVLR